MMENRRLPQYLRTPVLLILNPIFPLPYFGSD
jgi:hypothetical protein